MNGPKRKFTFETKPPITYSRQANLQRQTLSNRQKTLFVYKSDDETSTTNLGQITFTSYDRSLLSSPKYLNDTIISFFMQYHLDKQVAPEIKRRIHLFNTFFFAKIKSIKEKQQSDKDNITSFNFASRWLKGVKIFDKDFLIIPICERDHWVLVIVCYPSRTPSVTTANITDEELSEPAVIVLNSWKGTTPPIRKILNQFLTFRWKIEKKTPRNFNISSIDRGGIKLLFPSLPQQKNNYNCGVYLLNYFYCFLKNPRQAYVRMFRGRDMLRWFDINNIDPGKERDKMKRIVEERHLAWKPEQPEESADIEAIPKINNHNNNNNNNNKIRSKSQEGSDNNTTVPMIVDDNDSNNDSPIVINIC